MSTKELISNLGVPLEENEAVQIIEDQAHSDLYFSILLAISYGIVLGKRQERTKRHNEPIAKIVRILRLASPEQLNSIYQFVLYYVR